MRVLFLTHRLPFPPNRGDRIRAFHMLRTLASHADVELVSLVHDPLEAEGAARLAEQVDVRITTIPVPYYRNRVAAVAALAGNRPLTHVLLNAPDVVPILNSIVEQRPPDVVLAYCSGMAQFAMHSPLADFPLVLDLIDVDSQKWAQLASTSTPPLSWIYAREARLLGRFEGDALSRASASFVVNDRELTAARALCSDAEIMVLPNGVDVEAFSPQRGATDQHRVVFCGVMNYEPNVQGVLWFASHVWPLIRRAVPGATFTVVGSDPTDQVRRLGSTEAGIEVTGRVPDVTKYLWRAAVAVAPIHVARGVQNKVLEAVAAGLPTVVTPAVFEGLPNEVRVACRLGDSADEFARQAIRLLRMSGAERRAFAARANCAALSWERQMAPLPQILEHAIRVCAPAAALTAAV